MKSASEIQEGNRLISEFMGGKSDKINFAPKNIRFEIPINGTYSFHVTNLKYHSSWDWLMPVVEKIEMLGYDTGICGVEIKGEKLSEVIISPIKKGNDKIEIHSRDAISKILLTWQVITQFICWYTSLPPIQKQ